MATSVRVRHRWQHPDWRHERQVLEDANASSYLSLAYRYALLFKTNPTAQDILASLVQARNKPATLIAAINAVETVVLVRYSSSYDVFDVLMLLLRIVRRNLAPLKTIGVVVYRTSAVKGVTKAIVNKLADFPNATRVIGAPTSFGTKMEAYRAVQAKYAVAVASSDKVQLVSTEDELQNMMDIQASIRRELSGAQRGSDKGRNLAESWTMFALEHEAIEQQDTDAPVQALTITLSCISPMRPVLSARRREYI